MHIRSLQIRNYKSFRASPEIHFTPGFNVIVGQNNVGKTALVEALALRFGNCPPRSLKTVPTRNSTGDPVSRISISFELSPDELEKMLGNEIQEFQLMLPKGTPIEQYQDNVIEFLSGLNRVKCIYESGNLVNAYLEHTGDQLREPNQYEIKMYYSEGQLKFDVSGTGGINLSKSLPGILTRILTERTYLFKAERFNISEAQIGANETLTPDASNLPQVLNLLQTKNVTRFQRFNRFVHRVFPEIRLIAVPAISTTHARIVVWSIDPDSERDDLTVPLHESGTGLGQVLAMLYVVLTSEDPRTIIIDEPQSFLHPGAIRKLFDIFKQSPQHQYIVTTHSPTVVTAADPQALYMVCKREGESTIEPINVGETQQLRVFLSEIGARLSDIFGADQILWVEGRTEELCFPLILSRVAKQHLFGTAILGVISTGDFEGRHSKTAWAIYKRLSTGTGLLPPALGFIFDREGRSKQDIEDLERKSKGAVVFLPRRMYENYLLNPHALASVMASIEGFREPPVTAADVEEWLQCNGRERKYVREAVSEEERSNEWWLKNVHGAKILEELFAELSESRVAFNKTDHDVALTNWIVEKAPSDLEEIAELLKNVLARAEP